MGVMTTTTTPSTAPLLHPRLARLDPSLRPTEGHGSRHQSRLALLTGTLGACLTITFAAHALQGPLPVSSPQPARTLARSAQLFVSAI